MYSSRQPSNPGGPDSFFLQTPHNRMTHRHKYMGLNQDIYSVSLASPLGLAFFSSENIDVICSELYSRAIQKLRHEIPRDAVEKPRLILVKQKCDELYPLYAPTVHKLDPATLPLQVRELNSIMADHILSNYITDIRGNQRYRQSLAQLPFRQAQPMYVEAASHKEPVNRTMALNPSELGQYTNKSDENTKNELKDLTSRTYYQQPLNAWLIKRPNQTLGGIHFMQK